VAQLQLHDVSLRQTALEHNKARSMNPGRLPAQLICPRIGASVAIVMLGNNRDRSIRALTLRLWGGAAGAGTWGQVSKETSHWVRGTSSGALDGAAIRARGTSEIR